MTGSALRGPPVSFHAPSSRVPLPPLLGILEVVDSLCGKEHPFHGSGIASKQDVLLLEVQSIRGTIRSLESLLWRLLVRSISVDPIETNRTQCWEHGSLREDSSTLEGHGAFPFRLAQRTHANPVSPKTLRRLISGSRSFGGQQGGHWRTGRESSWHQIPDFPFRLGQTLRPTAGRDFSVGLERIDLLTADP
ncbi:hypothetical protein SAMN02746041_00119 [Desulfacinum hydrothermale DSM 13146]|uniref:Uncharacterized protein n=1 Tax=Desulfacinum hydrothermale DSM 13146 TaxID=1121390 RepID=A0A1W1WZP3_9BACT|nr:hypothetical protein SAMN02746041_00119 [Desulfacinum hydrothermale DSM 13146]